MFATQQVANTSPFNRERWAKPSANRSVGLRPRLLGRSTPLRSRYLHVQGAPMLISLCQHSQPRSNRVANQVIFGSRENSNADAMPFTSSFLFSDPLKTKHCKKPCFSPEIYFGTIWDWQSTVTKIVIFAIASKQNYKRLTFSQTRIKRLCHLPMLSRRGPYRTSRRWP